MRDLNGSDYIVLLGGLGIAGLATLFVALYPGHRDGTDLANVCARSKANVELLNLCGETPGCMYTKKEIQETVRSVAACELAKVTP